MSNNQQQGFRLIREIILHPLRSSLKVQLDNLFRWCRWQLWLD